MIRFTLWVIAIWMLIFLGAQVAMTDIQHHPVKPPPCHKKVCLV